ncbi:MAG TPA: deoxyguanosinetriphosphate triphosphohydrolase, partial [Waddliaceae bacterium]
KLSEEYANTVFAHSWQSCRLLSSIEPLNLGLAVYDGFLCHDGGIGTTKLTPRYGKTWQDHFDDLEQKLADPAVNIIPGTLEGCLVKLCDTMSYIGRDIEDAINMGIISRDQIPKTCLGKTNGEILTFLACDMISESYEREYIAISQEAHDALCLLRGFNFKQIYMHPKLKVESIKVERSFRILFEFLLRDYQKMSKKSFIWQEFLSNKPEEYVIQSEPARMVVDYISGMTDSFFVRTLEKLIVPKRIEL